MNWKNYCRTCFVKFVLPVFFGICVFLRQNVIAFGYLLLFFSTPWWNTKPTVENFRAGLGLGLKMAIFWSSLSLFSQMAFQFVIFFFKKDFPFTFCEPSELLLRHIGLIKWNDWPVADVVASILPDAMVMTLSLELLRRYTLNVKKTPTVLFNPLQDIKKYEFVLACGRSGVTMLLILVAIMSPSPLGMIYFILALATGLSVACQKRTFFSIPVLGVLLAIIIVNIVAIFVVQMQWFQEGLPQQFLRLAHIVPVRGWDCEKPYEHVFLTTDWEAFCIGPVLLCLYWCTGGLLHHTYLSESLRQKRGRFLWELLIERVTVTGATGLTAKAGSRRSNLWKAFLNLSYQKYLNEAVTIAACSCMLIWSAVYVGWTSLVLLVWAAGLCLFPKMKARTLASAPPLVLYAYFMLLVHYMYSVPPIAFYLRSFISEEYGIDGGFDTTTGLVIKSIFTFFFLLLLRLYLNQRRSQLHRKEANNKIGGEEMSIHEVFLNTLFQRARFYFVLFWILVVISTVLVFICTGGPVTIFRIIYVFLFVFFILVFQFSYDGWRNVLDNYWLSLGIVTLLALILEYTYSFKYIRDLWDQTGIPDRLKGKIGFQSKGAGETRVTLLKLSAILITVMVQIQLNDEFLEATNVRKKLKGEFGHDVMDEIIKNTMKTESQKVNLLFKIVLTIYHAAVFILEIIQLHLLKILIIILALLAVEHVSALHWLLFALVLSSLCVRQRHRFHIIRICTILVAAHTIQWMLLDIVDLRDKEIVCTQTIMLNFSDSPVEANYTGGILEWIGFLLVKESTPYTSSMIIYHMSVIMVSTVAIAVNRFMLFRGFLRGEYTRQAYVLFPGVRRSDADYNMKGCFKFLANYTFYKFGVEICFIAMLIVVGLRWDLYSIILLLWIFALFSCERKTIRKMWFCLLYYMYFCLILQYAFLLNLPPDICLAYPWYTNRRWRVLQDWLSLPDPILDIKTNYIIYDVLLLILVSRQRVVFSIEKKYGSSYPGGNNDRIRVESENPFFINPVPDFVTFIRSWLDILKHYYFITIYWMTLFVIFLTSCMQVNLFSIGYMIASFVMFWLGEDFYLFTSQHMNRKWNCLILYNLTVMFIKTALQFAANMIVDTYGKYYCIALSAWSLRPDAHPGREAKLTGAISTDKNCTYIDDAVIAWDIVCFAFLIISRRAYTSYYFIHIVNDAKATMIISSRGAQIFDRIRIHDITIQTEKEKEIIQNLTGKMNRLRQKQQKLKENPFFVSATSHYDAIRAGDYFMYDEREMQVEDEQREADEWRVRRRRAIRASRPRSFVAEPDKKAKRAARGLSFRAGAHADDDADDDDDLEPTDVDEQHLTLGNLLAKTKSHTIEETVKNVRRSRHSNLTVVDISSSDDDKEQREERNKKKSKIKKCKNYSLWIYYLIDSGVMTLALTMYGYTKNYRFVVNEMRKEKKLLLVRGTLRGYRVKNSSQWTPFVTDPGQLSMEEDFLFSETLKERGIQAALQNTAEKAQGEFLKMSHRSSYFSLLTSIFYVTLAYSELICYLLIVMHQLLEPSVISLIMSTSMYLWATLSTPRPAKTYWVTLMAYIEIVIVIKTVVQFPSFTEILGLEGEKIANEFAIIGLPLYRSPTSTVLSILVFGSIIFHRFRLRKFGLWEDSKKSPWENTPSEGTSYFSLKPAKLQIHDEEETIYRLSNTTSLYRKEKPESATKYMPHVLILPIMKFRGAFTQFFKDLLTSPTRYHTDVYACTFFLDLISFLITLFGISHFGVLYRDWYWYFDRNRFPLSIFILLFGQFFLMIIDRIIYVRKNITAKLYFYFAHVVIIHVYLFIFLPLSAYRRVSHSRTLQAFYVVKSMYFLVSAYQIRSGYAVYEHGYLFRKKFGFFYMCFHKVFMLVPFIFEMRTIIDWAASDTTFTFFEFFKMEDVYNYAYAVKCFRSYEVSCPKKRGTPNTIWLRVFLGGVILLGLIFILWFPFILFQMRHELGIPRGPNALKIQIMVDMFPAIYEGKSYSVRMFTEPEWKDLTRLYKNNPSAQDSLRYFDYSDIVVIKVPPESLIWTVPTEVRELMATNLRTNEEVLFTVYWELEYSLQEVVRGYRMRRLKLGDAVRVELADMLETPPSISEKSVVVPNVMPKFLDSSQVGSTTDPEGSVAVAFLRQNPFRNLRLYLQDTNYTGRTQLTNRSEGVPRDLPRVRFQQWKVREECNGSDWDKILRHLPESECVSIVMYVFSERKFGFWLDMLSSMGSTAIYYIIMLTLSRILRTVLRDTTQKLALTEMPYPDRLLELCHDIYAVRIAKNFDLEEDLFAKLLFLLRSPETLVMFTRKPVTKDKHPSEMNANLN